jgi:hypothetical protein
MILGDRQLVRCHRNPTKKVAIEAPKHIFIPQSTCGADKGVWIGQDYRTRVSNRPESISTKASRPYNLAKLRLGPMYPTVDFEKRPRVATAKSCLGFDSAVLAGLTRSEASSLRRRKARRRLPVAGGRLKKRSDPRSVGCKGGSI